MSLLKAIGRALLGEGLQRLGRAVAQGSVGTMRADPAARLDWYKVGLIEGACLALERHSAWYWIFHPRQYKAVRTAASEAVHLPWVAPVNQGPLLFHVLQAPRPVNLRKGPLL